MRGPLRIRPEAAEGGGRIPLQLSIGIGLTNWGDSFCPPFNFPHQAFYDDIRTLDPRANLDFPSCQSP